MFIDISNFDYYHAKCYECGRHQVFQPLDETTQGSALTIREIEWLGWREMTEGWLCPLCSGQTKNLEEIFYISDIKGARLEDYGRGLYL